MLQRCQSNLHRLKSSNINKKAIARISFEAMLKNDIKSQKSIVGVVKYFLSLFGRMVRTDELQTFLSDRPGTDC